MSKAAQIIHIGLSFDENYLIPFYVLLTSLLKNNNVGNTIKIHAIATGIKEEEKERIREFVNQYDSLIEFYKVDQELIKTFSVTNEPRFTMAVYYRLFFPHLLNCAIDRILYLDIDMIVLADLSPLYNSMILPAPISAAIDGGINPCLGIEDHDEYFNSGVMLIDLKCWKEQHVTEKAIAFLQEFPEKALYHDQDALNVVLRNNWTKIDNNYNLTIGHIPDYWFVDGDNCSLQRSENIPPGVVYQHEIFLKEKVIIHYNGTEKPWVIGALHPFKYIYNDYFIEFSETNTGRYLIPRNFDFQFSCLMIDALKSTENDTQSKILLSFILQSAWLKSIAYFSIKKRKAETSNDYWQAAKPADDHLNELLLGTFEKNKALLNDIFYSIFFLNSISEYLDDDWLQKWIKVCKQKQRELRKTTDVDSLGHIPYLINKQLGIAEELQSFPVYSILKLSENYSLA